MSAQKFSWRMVWYSVLIWLLFFIVGTVVVLPWFYLVMPMVIFWATVYYFKKGERTLAAGLRVSLFWFVVASSISILEILGLYYRNFVFYFSSFRNWFLYPLVLLIPVIYTLIIEGKKVKKKSRTVKSSRLLFPLNHRNASY